MFFLLNIYKTLIICENQNSYTIVFRDDNINKLQTVLDIAFIFMHTNY